MEDDKSICVLCAWRQNCNKKFSIASAGVRRCPDYVRDLALPRPTEEAQQEETK
ncbi:MAG: hypothetical protein QG577_441 [Thermodesulfobacteriota bacterium]|nr:hypothetical protein [Thermodesulfobacteriota bacterium]